MSRKLLAWSLVWLFAWVGSTSAQSPQPRQSQDVYGNNLRTAVHTNRRAERKQAATLASQKTEKPEKAERLAQPATPSLRIAVIGQVGAPGVYEFAGTPSLENLVDQAGGLTRFGGRDLYLTGRNRPLTKIDLAHLDAVQLIDGDILLVETPVHYYTAAKMSDVHPQTQIALLGLADYPVVLKVPPQNARLKDLLATLNQGPEVVPGIRILEPPHAREIPPTAQIAPNLIPSGTILWFDRSLVKLASLPALPLPVAVRTANGATADAVVNAALESRDKPVKFSRTKHTTVDPQVDRELSDPVLVDESGYTRIDLSTQEPVAIPQVTAESGKHKPKPAHADASVLPSAFEAEAAPAEPANDVWLSPQQKRYIIYFCVVVALFAVADVVRRRSTVFGYQRRSLAYGIQGTDQDVRNPQRPSLPSATTTAPERNERPEPVAPAAPPVPEPRTPEPPQPKFETIAISDTEELPQQTAVETTDESAPVQEDLSSLTITLQGLIGAQYPVIEEPVQEIRAIAEPPAEDTPSDAAPAPVAMQPLFPIIWRHAAPVEDQPADLPRFQPQQPAEPKPAAAELPPTKPQPEPAPAAPAASVERRIDQPHAAPAASAAPRPKMLQPRPGTGGSLLDRVFLAVQREKRK